MRKYVLNIKTCKYMLAALAAAVLVSCGSAGLSAPTGLKAADADPENPNRIEISWLPVEGADIYYVYRDTSETGTFAANAGFSVTSRTESDGVVRYAFMETFDEGEGGTYHYKVTAADNSNISIESPMSAAVTASTYSGTWSKAADSVIAESALQLSLAADTSALYAVYTSASGAIAAKKWAEDSDSAEDPKPYVWTALTGSPGSSPAGAAADPPDLDTLVSGGELYTAFSDSSTTPDPGAVSMKYYHDSGTDDAPSFAWTAAGTAGFNGAAGKDINAASVGFGGDIYTAFLETTTLNLAKYDTNIGNWFEPNTVTGVGGTISTLSHNNSLYVCYEAGDELYCRAWDGSALQTGGLVSTSASGINVVDGNAVFVSGGGDLYAVFIKVGGGLEVLKLTDGSWAALADVDGDSPPQANDAAAYGTLAAHWFNGYLYVFYPDSSEGKGRVSYYSETDGWCKTSSKDNSEDVTSSGAGIGSFQLASSGTELYAGYVEGGEAYVRILQ